MRKSNEELREQINEMLLFFVDFIYALVFLQIVAALFDHVILFPPEKLSKIEKAKRLVPVFAIFYFLAWDWIGGRILTLKNRYKGYTRFFTEIAIAFSAYGAVLEIVDYKIFFLWYIFLMQAFGVLWAWRTLREYPNSPDKRELLVILEWNTCGSILTLLTLKVLYKILGPDMRVREIVIVIICEVIFILFYELGVPRASDVLGGPQLPFVSRRKASMIRSGVRFFYPGLSRKKGESNEEEKKG